VAAVILTNAVVITGFVVVMMLLVEYLNVVTRGTLRQRVQKNGGRLPAIVIGTVPGCFGAFTNVTLYVHGAVSLGALAGSMIAATGDEAFVMLALFPRRALMLFVLLFAYGLVVARLVDRLFGVRHFRQAGCASGLTVHEAEAGTLHLLRLPPEGIRWSRDRVLLAGGVLAFALAIGLGLVASDLALWLRTAVALLSFLLVGLVIVAPEHFVRVHLVRHVVREHAPRIFFWTLGALAVTEWAMRSGLGIETFIRNHTTLALVVAAAVGVVPESGPHLVFATLYASGVLPFSVLLTSSVVQDGHGMLPLLAESRVEFLRVKAINVVAGLALGFPVMLLGY
jgi:Putative, 10TM heavy-metal exporter